MFSTTICFSATWENSNAVLILQRMEDPLSISWREKFEVVRDQLVEICYEDQSPASSATEPTI